MLALRRKMTGRALGFVADGLLRRQEREADALDDLLKNMEREREAASADLREGLAAMAQL